MANVWRVCLYTLWLEAGEWLSVNYLRLAVVCKGCVSVTCGMLAVVYYGILHQSLVVNWRLSVWGVLCQLHEAG
jgi:hypothetical protein